MLESLGPGPAGRAACDLSKWGFSGSAALDLSPLGSALVGLWVQFWVTSDLPLPSQIRAGLPAACSTGMPGLRGRVGVVDMHWDLPVA